jgi:hypothetical protein
MLSRGVARITLPSGEIMELTSSYRCSVVGVLRRPFDSEPTADRPHAGGASGADVLVNALLRYERGEIVWLWQTGEQRPIPYPAVHQIAKLPELELGLRHERQPLVLSRRHRALASAVGDGR